MAKLDEIDTEKNPEATRPCFLGARPWQGYLQVQCSDGLTLDWLKSQIKSIKLDSSILCVRTKDQLPKTLKASFFIPGKTVVPKTVLKRIATQNKGLRTSGWRIIHASKQSETGRFLVVAVDETSAGLIRSQNSEIFYGLEKIQIRLKPQGLIQ
jgi:Domain of unknown function (DUF4780)